MMSALQKKPRLSFWLAFAGLLALLLGTTAFQTPTGGQDGSAPTPPAAGEVSAEIGKVPPASQGAGSRIYLPLAANGVDPATSPGGDGQSTFPIRAAFYYPWFPESWTQSGTFPYTHYHPSLGYYSSSDQKTIKKHIAAMQYGHIQAGIASWWGQGHNTDDKLKGMLRAADGTDFHWGIYYENESTGDPSVAQIRSDLTYIRNQYGKDPSLLRVGGKFVVFVYSWTNDTCAMADRWKQANTVGAYIVLKVFPGFASCASQPDGWHQYAPAAAADQQGGESFAISPGFWLWGQPVRLARNLAEWKVDVQKLFAAKVKFQLVTTFNEWGEGTSVESADEWASPSGYGKYLDALHTYGK